MSQRPIQLLALLALALSACRGAPDARRESPAPAAPAVVPKPDTRDQYAFARAISKAESSPSRTRAREYERVRADFRGKRYRWEARYEPVLCSRADACVVVPFDQARERVVQGFLPRLALDKDAHAELRRVCKPHASCVVRFSATLSKLALSAELPTSLELGDVSIEGARAEKPGESWGRAARH